MGSPARRRRHSREEVLAAAEAIADRDGWRGLSMTSLAAELGVKVPSLYNHVPNLEALRGQLQNRAFAELGVLLRNAAMGKVREQGMRAMAGTLRTWALDHPGRYDLAMQEPIDRAGFIEASREASGAMRALMDSYGVADEDAQLQLSFFAGLHGVLALENAGFFSGAADGDVIYENVLQALLATVEAEPSEALAG